MTCWNIIRCVAFAKLLLKSHNRRLELKSWVGAIKILDHRMSTEHNTKWLITVQIYSLQPPSRRHSARKKNTHQINLGTRLRAALWFRDDRRSPALERQMHENTGRTAFSHHATLRGIFPLWGFSIKKHAFAHLYFLLMVKRTVVI